MFRWSQNKRQNNVPSGGRWGIHGLMVAPPWASKYLDSRRQQPREFKPRLGAIRPLSGNFLAIVGPVRRPNLMFCRCFDHFRADINQIQTNCNYFRPFSLMFALPLRPLISLRIQVFRCSGHWGAPLGLWMGPIGAPGKLPGGPAGPPQGPKRAP